MRVSWKMIVGVVVAVCVVGCMGGSKDGPTPCPWPAVFSTQWDIAVTNTTTPPPYAETGLPPAASSRYGRGATYYSWKERALREDYHDFCVPIFPPSVGGFDFPCTFLNVEDTSYFLTTSSGRTPPSLPECCIFERPWHAPPPDFLVKLHDDLDYEGTIPFSPAESHSTRVWQWDVPSNEGGPFGYGFCGDTCPPEGAGEGGSVADGVPSMFYFAAIPPFTYTVQVYRDFHAVPPPPGVFTIPDECQNAVQCPNFPNITRSL